MIFLWYRHTGESIIVLWFHLLVFRNSFVGEGKMRCCFRTDSGMTRQFIVVAMVLLQCILGVGLGACEHWVGLDGDENGSKLLFLPGLRRCKRFIGFWLLSLCQRVFNWCVSREVHFNRICHRSSRDPRIWKRRFSRRGKAITAGCGLAPRTPRNQLEDFQALLCSRVFSPDTWNHVRFQVFRAASYT